MSLTHEIRNCMAPMIAAVSLLKRKVKPNMTEAEVADCQRLFDLHDKGVESMRVTLLAMDVQQRSSK